MAVDLQEDLAARTAELERFVRDFYERGVNQMDTSIIDDVIDEGAACDSECVWRIEGRQDVRDAWARYEKAFSNRNLVITDLTIVPNPGGEDQVTVWYTFTGRFVGELELDNGTGTIPPSGKDITLHGVSQIRLDDWQIVGGKAVTDMLGVLGTIPEESLKRA